MSEIKRGEIYWVSWNPARGSEQRGHRPALIIQNDMGNRASPNTIVAAVTAALDKYYPFMVPILLKDSGLPQDSVINLSQIVTVDKARLGDKCGELSKDKMVQVDKAIKVSLGLE